MANVDNILNLLEVGARAEGLRQRTLAANLANMETPGYRRQDVKFEELLAKELESSGNLDLDEIDPELFEPRQTVVKANGNDVSFEVEVGEMVKNSLRHKTYLRLMSKRYKQMEAAINTNS